MSLPSIEMPKLELPLTELPESYREWAKSGVAQLKDGYDKVKTATEAVGDVVVGSCKTGTDGALSYGAKLMGTTRQNTDAAIDLVGNLACATSVAEAFELSTAYLRRQCEVATVQGRELAALAQKVTADTLEPIKHGLAEAFPDAR